MLKRPDMLRSQSPDKFSECRKNYPPFLVPALFLSKEITVVIFLKENKSDSFWMIKALFWPCALLATFALLVSSLDESVREGWGKSCHWAAGSCSELPCSNLVCAAQRAVETSMAAYMCISLPFFSDPLSSSSLLSADFASTLSS